MNKGFLGLTLARKAYDVSRLASYSVVRDPLG
jgi:hypothetical protein